MTSRDRPWIALAGALFALGLALSGITQPRAILDAFRYDAHWDPHVMLMFAGANLVMIPATRWLHRRGRTLRGAPLRVVPRRPIDRALVVGSIVFGAGWGLAGLCPGPAVASVASGGAHAIAAFAGIGAGIFLHDHLRGA